MDGLPCFGTCSKGQVVMVEGRSRAPISSFCDYNVNIAVDLHVDILYSQGVDSSPDHTPGLDPKPYKASGWLFCLSSWGCPFQKGEERDLCTAWHFSFFSVAVIKTFWPEAVLGEGIMSSCRLWSITEGSRGRISGWILKQKSRFLAWSGSCLGCFLR